MVLLNTNNHTNIYNTYSLNNTKIIHFHHNNTKNLKQHIIHLNKQTKKTIIIIKNIYNILNNITPLTKIINIKHHLNNYLIINKTHSFNILNTTKHKLTKTINIKNNINIIINTFNKNLTSINNFTINSKTIKILHYNNHPYIFTTSPSPSYITTIHSSLKTITTQPKLQQKLINNTNHLYNNLQKLNYKLNSHINPIIPIIINSKKNNLHI